MLDYRGKLALAPMVRVSELPMRLLSLKYGADLVWGPEIVDKKLICTKRLLNPELHTVDFVTSSDNKLVFRTRPELEKSRLVFQIGTADALLAVQAAKVVAKDVAGIDVNSGCPKHFSIHSGMGAALLQTPDRLVCILEALVQHVGEPFGVSISVKIRLLENLELTCGLVERLVKTGISCLTVHCRTTPMRPREAPMYDQLEAIAKICHRAKVACLVNGGVTSREDLARFVSRYGVDGAMIATAAESDPSCFGERRETIATLASEFVSLARVYGYPHSHVKYCLTKMIPGRNPLYQLVAQAKSLDELESLATDSSS